MFADDTKIWIKIVTQEDVTKLQEDLNSLCDWSKKWLLQFNPQKCVVMHIGHNMNSRYHFSQDNQNWELKSVSEEKDLGVLVTSNIIVNIPSCLPGNHNKEGKMAVPNYFVSDFFTEGWCEPWARIGKVVIAVVRCDNP